MFNGTVVFGKSIKFDNGKTGISFGKLFNILFIINNLSEIVDQYKT